MFFNSALVGGADDLTRLDEEGKLDGMISDCLLAPDVPEFPPPFRKPKSEEYIKVSCIHVTQPSIGPIAMLITCQSCDSPS